MQAVFKPGGAGIAISGDKAKLGEKAEIGQAGFVAAVPGGMLVFAAVPEEELVPGVGRAERDSDDEIVRAVKVYVFGADGIVFGFVVRGEIELLAVRRGEAINVEVVVHAGAGEKLRFSERALRAKQTEQRGEQERKRLFHGKTLQNVFPYNVSCEGKNPCGVSNFFGR